MRTPSLSRRPPVALLLLLLAVGIGCERRADRAANSAAPAGAVSAATAVRSNRLIGSSRQLQRARVGNETRVVLPPTLRQVSLVAPAKALVDLRFGVQKDLWKHGARRVDFSVIARSAGEQVTVFHRRIAAPTHKRPNAWHTARVSLDRFAGKPVSLALESRLVGGSAPPAGLTLWSNPRLVPERVPPRPPGGPPNIILISIDTLRADHLGAYGYQRETSPNLDRLASRGVRFRRVISPSGWTLPAHASLFTGLLPRHHGATMFGFTTPIPLRFDTLAERLWNAGYETAGFTDGLFVSGKLNFDQGFGVYNDAEGWVFHRRFHSIVARASKWLDQGRPGPFFLFLHTYEAHMPYQPPTRYETLFDPGYTGLFAGGVTDEQSGRTIWDESWIPDSAVPHLEALYDGSIRSVDDAIGELLALLDARGLRKSTCIVVTSDHGDEFRDHGTLFHHHAKLYEEIVHVPLIISCPGRFAGGRVIDTTVSLMDVMPTLLELAGVPADGSLDARSLRPALDGKPLAERPLISELDGSVARTTGFTRALTDGDQRLIESTVPGLPRRELFDRAVDPGEQHDLSGERPQVVARLEAALGVPPPTAVVAAAAETPQVDAATRERLRALGYHNE